MDLITQLPPTDNGHDAIIVFVDKLTKMVHYAATTTTVDAPGVASLFFEHVVRMHGVPTSIVSDRDPRFTSLFWRSLWSLLGTKLAMSTAFHPQTDGQTERANRTLEEMLRAVVHFDQRDWDTHLIAAEIAFNNSVHASTGVSPFFFNFQQHPHLPLSVAVQSASASPNPSAADRLSIFHSHIAQATKSLQHAQARQAKYANQDRRDDVLVVGQSVMLSTQHLKLKVNSQTPKLLSKFIGPFVITEVVSPAAYRLALPPSLSIHPVFHISKLRPYVDGVALFPARSAASVPARPPPDILPDGEEEWEVEAVVGKRGRGNRLQYLVRWKGYPDHEKSWEPTRNLTHAQEKIREYEDAQL
jgi:hypothetical protein